LNLKIKVFEMTRNLDSKKLKLIQKITLISSIEEIKDIERFVNLIRHNKAHGNIFKEIRKDVNIESLKKEQDFKGIDRAKLNRIAKELDIKESIEELLSMID